MSKDAASTVWKGHGSVRYREDFVSTLPSVLLMTALTDLHSFKPITEIIAISKEILDTGSRIPTRATGRKPFSMLERSQFARVFVPLKRGGEPYCPARVAEVGGGVVGHRCLCHNHNSPVFRRYWKIGYHIQPERWSTTPAEADVNPRRPRRVQFAESPVTSVKEFDRWIFMWGRWEESTDPATDEDDEAEIAAINALEETF